jgi:hypothetical protein
VLVFLNGRHVGVMHVNRVGGPPALLLQGDLWRIQIGEIEVRQLAAFLDGRWPLRR